MKQEIPQPGYEEAFVDVVGARVRSLHAGSGRLILFAPAEPYSRSSDLMVRVYITPWAAISPICCPIFRADPAHRSRRDLWKPPPRCRQMFAGNC
jgi:hypothetical protein